MARTRIQGAEYPLKKIFSDDFYFVIPNYQRPYAWTSEQGLELFDDLLVSVGDGAKPADELDPYFLGSVVLVKEDDKPEAQVVDGQQRLTTLSILLSALRATLDPSASDHLNTFLYEEGNKIIGTPDRFRLSLRPRDQEFFRTYVQERGGIERLSQLDPAQLPDSQRNITENALLYMKKLRTLDRSFLVPLAQYIVNRCYLVAISTPDLDSAYRIFSVLNNRGLDLSHADILKAEIIGKLPREVQDEYTNRWEGTEEELGRSAFEDLFSHIRMIYLKTKLRATVLKEFRDHVVSSHSAQDVIDRIILPFADAYDVIRHSAYESTHRADDVNRMLRWLNRTDNVDWVPPAIRFLSEHRSDPEDLLCFLLDLERLAASMMIRRVGINDRIERYGRLLKAIHEGVDLYDENSPLQLNTAEERETIANLAADLYLVRPVRLYVLLRLDDALSDGGATYDYPLITVEHVLPQSPQAGGQWATWFPTEEVREQWVHKVANLVLLTGRKNSAASNYEFDEKKRRYFAVNGTSPFVLTSQVLYENRWTLETLEARQRQLLEEFRRIWRLSRTVGLPTDPH